MSNPTAPADDFDRIVAEFVQQLEGADDPQAVIRAYTEQYPAHAHEFPAIAAMHGVLVGLPDDSEAPHPERLGDFRILGKISHGGMGVVYEAIQEPLDRRVAVKVIRRGRISKEYRERFLREQHVLARLHQTHIVPVFAAGEEGPIQYFAMPYIEGAALHHIVEAAGRWRTHGLTKKTPSLGLLARAAIVQTGHGAKPSPGQAATESWTDSSRFASTLPPLGEDLDEEDRARERRVPLNGQREESTHSSDYLRSVAELMADVAESVQHAHEQNFIHRDLKPSNIMVDTSGQSWLIDFGLAGLLADGPSAASGHGVAEGTCEPGLTRHGLGTPGYMAPEQETGGPTDERTDVWGLGVTLYELLTLRRAFPGGLWADGQPGKQPLHPASPRTVVKNVPRDLEAISMKAVQFPHTSRYATARDFAADLRRWLRDEPTKAYGAWVPRRLWLWAKRNWGWAVAIAVALLLLTTLWAGALAFERQRANRATRASLLVRAQQVRLAARPDGWSKEAWDLVRDAANLGRDDVVRDEAAATLAGLDARKLKHFEEFGAQRIAFDPQGKWLLMGPTVDKDGRTGPARLWNLETDGLEDLDVIGLGPLGFRADGMPLQLVAGKDAIDPASEEKRPRELLLVELRKAKVIGRFAVPDGSAFLSPEDAAMMPGGSLVAASASTPKQAATVAVWDGKSGKLLHRFPVKASALRFSPDGSLLGAGEDTGQISVWSLADGKQVCTLRARHNAIRCLAFGRDPCRRSAALENPAAAGWLLASGDAGGTVTIWDLGEKVVRTYCHGSRHDVWAVAFSPDGATIGSAGRTPAKLWDTATGRMLLNLPASNWQTDIAFSPDGQKVAVSTITAFRWPSEVFVWDLENGRGIRTLRGLVGHVSKIRFAGDSRRIAALAHDWQLAVWDLPRGELLHVFEAPKGITSDNAALAFSPDGSRLAFSAGPEARSWDVSSGKELNRWQLNDAVGDALAFAGLDRLLSFRAETQQGKPGPFSNAPPQKYPRVCRLRELPDKAPARLLKEIHDFNWHVYPIAASPDGSCFVVDGCGGANGERRSIKVYDGAGKEVGSIPSSPRASGHPRIDTSGKLLVVATNNTPQGVLFEIPSCRHLAVLEVGPAALSPGGALMGYFGLSGTAREGVSLVRSGSRRPLVTLGAESTAMGGPIEFDSGGRLVAWGTRDGSVALCDIQELRRKLAEVELGW